MALISPEYVREQEILHTAPDGYGDRAFNYSYLVAGIATVKRCASILDYGCGKGSLGRELTNAGLNIKSYDPGIPAYAAMPKPADLVACLDVLEHIEPECLFDVLAHIRELTRKVLFTAIATRPAGKTLSDGRNAHLIIENDAWWYKQLENHGFEVRRVWNTGVQEFVALLVPSA